MVSATLVSHVVLSVAHVDEMSMMCALKHVPSPGSQAAEEFAGGCQLRSELAGLISSLAEV